MHPIEEVLSILRPSVDTNTPPRLLVERRALAGTLPSSRVRSVHWSILLGLCPAAQPPADLVKSNNNVGGEHSNSVSVSSVVTRWIDELATQRATARAAFASSIVDPHSEGQGEAEEDQVIDPLSQEPDSQWSRYFATAELRREIAQDVERTYPEIAYFSEGAVQEALARVLLVYADHENPGLSYRQGMHELAAPLLYLRQVDGECVAEQLTDVDEELTEDEAAVARFLRTAYDRHFVEEDAYLLFVRLMSYSSDFFSAGANSRAPSTRPMSPALALSPRAGTPGPADTPMQRKCTFIQGAGLARRDPELAAYLASLDILPQLYALRWVRLLFSREFAFHDTLLIWDALFAKTPVMSLIDWIAVELLVDVRDKIIGSDAGGVLQALKDAGDQGVDVRQVLSRAVRHADMVDQGLPLPHPATGQRPGSDDAPAGKVGAAVMAGANAFLPTAAKGVNAAAAGFRSMLSAVDESLLRSVKGDGSTVASTTTAAGPTAANTSTRTARRAADPDEPVPDRIEASLSVRDDARHPDANATSASGQAGGGPSSGRRPRASTAARARAAEAELAEKRKTDRLMAIRLTRIVNVLQDQVLPESPVVEANEPLLLSICELKQIRDVLNGLISRDSL